MIGEGFAGDVPNGAHINLLLGAKNGPMGTANLRNPTHETMTWGPAQMGVAAGITMAVLDGVLPAEARQDWVAIACVWVHWDANDADAVFANNRDAALAAARAAVRRERIGLDELRQALESQGESFYTPRR